MVVLVLVFLVVSVFTVPIERRKFVLVVGCSFVGGVLCCKVFELMDIVYFALYSRNFYNPHNNKLAFIL